MSKALPGAHYCVAHQGNHSHYAEHNCELCVARAEVERLSDLHKYDRWNFEPTHDGLRVCRGDHERSDECEWEYYVLRAEVEQLKQERDEAQSTLAAIILSYDPSETLWDLRKRGVAILRERDRYRDALERLARLGNGNLPGNSDGNVIAQDALTGGEAGNE